MESTASPAFKKKVYELCRQMVEEKIELLKKNLNDLVESTKNETKSSAGDKYETGRAMLQIEQDNSRKQLKESLNQKANFDSIELNTGVLKITKGSLVQTNHGFFYLSIALGKLNVDGRVVIALSPQSPLGSKMLGLKINESIGMANTAYVIEHIQ